MKYKYKGISSDGLLLKGTVEASDEYTAIAQIKQTCQIVTKITPVRKLSAILSKEINPRQIDFRTLSILCSQFSYLLKSGISLAKSVDLIARQTENKRVKKLLEEAKQRVVSGQGLADSLQEADRDGFPLTFLETIRSGEHSGTMDKCFENLAVYYEKQYKMRQKLSAAMTYPSFVLFVAVMVVLIVMIKVIPIMTDIFAELGGELPLSTRILINISGFCQNYLIETGLLVLLAVVLYLCSIRTERGRIFWSCWKLKVPVLGRIRLLNASGQFAHTTSIMLMSGLTLTQAVETAAKTTENDILAKETARIAEKLREGRSFGDCMRESKCYPEALNEICAIGEEAGELEQMLTSIGNYFDNQADYATKKAMASLEPALLIALAVVTGFLVISIYMPLFTMYSLM